MKLSMRLRLALVALPAVLATVLLVPPAHAAFPASFLIKSGDPAHAGECAAANTDTRTTSVGKVVTKPCNYLDPTQQWTYNASNTGELRVLSGTFAGQCADSAVFLDVGSGNPDVYMNPCDGSATQAWNLDASQHISGSFPNPVFGPQPGACWGTTTRLSGTIQLTMCSTTGDPTQVWTAMPSRFLIKSGDPAHAGQCAFANTNPMFAFVGTVETETCDASDPTQQWTYNASNTGELRVLSGQFAGECADQDRWITANPTAPPLIVQMKPCDGSAGQVWNKNTSQQITGTYVDPVFGPGAPVCWHQNTQFTYVIELVLCSTTVDPRQVWVVVPV